jgi:hypothetical protein
MSFKIIGRVQEAESGVGLPGLEVRAYDQDVGLDDLLGSVVTDAEGRFTIEYEEKDFQELFDEQPDVFLTVRAQDGRVLYTTENTVRVDANKLERFDDIRLPRKLVSGAPACTVGLRFSERMSGYFLEGTEDFKQGALVGQRRNNQIEIRCRITIDDLDRFLREPEHTARLEGQLDYGDLGKRLSMQNGLFNLFVYDAVAGMRKMMYRFHFHSESGQPYLFCGEKYIHQEHSPTEVIKDMTTLHTRIYHGQTTAGKVASAGILTFKATNLMELFGTLEVLNASSTLEQTGALTRFMSFVSRELSTVYGL